MGYDKFYSGHSMDAIVHKYIIYIHSSHKIQGGNFHFNHYDCTSKIIEKQRWKTELMIDFQKKGVVHFIH